MNYHQFIGNILIEKGILIPDMVETLRKTAQKSGQLFAGAVIDQGFLSEEEWVAFLRDVMGFPEFEPDPTKIHPKVLRLLPQDIMQRFCVTAIYLKGKTLGLAMLDPFNGKLIDQIQTKIGGTVEVYVATRSNILATIAAAAGEPTATPPAAPAPPAEPRPAPRPSKPAEVPSSPTQEPTPPTAKKAAKSAAKPAPASDMDDLMSAISGVIESAKDQIDENSMKEVKRASRSTLDDYREAINERLAKASKRGVRRGEQPEEESPTDIPSPVQPSPDAVPPEPYVPAESAEPEAATEEEVKELPNGFVYDRGDMVGEVPLGERAAEFAKEEFPEGLTDRTPSRPQPEEEPDEEVPIGLRDTPEDAQEPPPAEEVAVEPIPDEIPPGLRDGSLPSEPEPPVTVEPREVPPVLREEPEADTDEDTVYTPDLSDEPFEPPVEREIPSDRKDEPEVPDVIPSPVEPPAPPEIFADIETFLPSSMNQTPREEIRTGRKGMPFQPEEPTVAALLGEDPLPEEATPSETAIPFNAVPLHREEPPQSDILPPSRHRITKEEAIIAVLSQSEVPEEYVPVVSVTDLPSTTRSAEELRQAIEGELKKSSRKTLDEKPVTQAAHDEVRLSDEQEMPVPEPAEEPQVETDSAGRAASDEPSQEKPTGKSGKSTGQTAPSHKWAEENVEALETIPPDPTYLLDSLRFCAEDEVLPALAGSLIAGETLEVCPVVIWSEPGLGKTHIMHALHQALGEDKSRRDAIALTTGSALGSWIEAGLKTVRADRLAGYLDSLQYLLVDGLQDFPSSRPAQQALIALIQQFARRNAAVIFTLDRSPEDLEDFQPGVRQMLEAGLVFPIHIPGREIRRELLVANQGSQSLPADVLDYLSRGEERSVRHLLGALRKLMTMQKLRRKTLSLNEVQALFPEYATSGEATSTGDGSSSQRGSKSSKSDRTQKGSQPVEEQPFEPAPAMELFPELDLAPHEEARLDEFSMELPPPEPASAQEILMEDGELLDLTPIPEAAAQVNLPGFEPEMDASEEVTGFEPELAPADDIPALEPDFTPPVEVPAIEPESPAEEIQAPPVTEMLLEPLVPEQEDEFPLELASSPPPTENEAPQPKSKATEVIDADPSAETKRIIKKLSSTRGVDMAGILDWSGDWVETSGVSDFLEWDVLAEVVLEKVNIRALSRFDSQVAVQIQQVDVRNLAALFRPVSRQHLLVVVTRLRTGLVVINHQIEKLVPDLMRILK